MIDVAPGAVFEATAEWTTGLVGTLGIRITDNQGATTVARVTAGITEYPSGSGLYQKTLTAPTTAGQYSIVWDDGTLFASDELVVGFTPLIGASSPQYITTAALKATLTLTGTTFADADIPAAITAASRTIDNICNRRFYTDADTAQVRYYSPIRTDQQEIEDLISLTSLKTDPAGDGTFPQTWTLNTDFVLEPLDAQANSAYLQPFTRIRMHPKGSYTFPTVYPRTVQVTGKFGWATVPDAIVNATTVLANLLLTVSRSAPLGIVAFEGGAIRVARGNPQVMMLVSPYMRHRVAVA